MKEICKLAIQKGFKAKALSTEWTLKDYNGKNSGFKINDTCDYLLLCEIQKWLRYQFEIDILIDYDGVLYDVKIVKHHIDTTYLTSTFGSDTRYEFINYEDALKQGILEVLQSDIEKYRNSNESK